MPSRPADLVPFEASPRSGARPVGSDVVVLDGRTVSPDAVEQGVRGATTALTIAEATRQRVDRSCDVHGAPLADRFPIHAEQYNQDIKAQSCDVAAGRHLATAMVAVVQAVERRSALFGHGRDTRAALPPPTAVLDEETRRLFHRLPRSGSPQAFIDGDQGLEELVDLPWHTTQPICDRKLANA